MPLWLLVLCGCEHDLPEIVRDGRISGTVSYAGSAHRAMLQPVLDVLAFAWFPPQGPPSGERTVLAPALGPAGVPYDLPHVPPGAYYVLARLVDLADPVARDAAIVETTGAHPSYCALFEEPQGNVSVALGQETAHVDITLHDASGAADPCTGQPASLCPQPDRGTLALTVTTAQVPAPEDQLIVGLFPGWPPTGAPTRVQTLRGSQLSFPQRVVDSAVPPGAHAVYVCLDRGSDDGASLCGQEDSWMVYGGGSQTVQVDAGRIVSLELDLDGQSSSTPVDEDPAAHACPAGVR
jgi:hypothetical protein